MLANILSFQDLESNSLTAGAGFWQPTCCPAERRENRIALSRPRGKGIEMPVRAAIKLLVVGPASNFSSLFERLEERGFHFESVQDTGAARTYLLGQSADVALLCLLPEQPDYRTALAWLRGVKGELPVVVISSEADMRPYLAAMESGAFDYLTTLTPLAEIERVLANAARWRHRAVA